MGDIIKKTRIEELDIIKCIAILMVVFGHTLCPVHLKVLFYWVHMPLFFLLSGITAPNINKYSTRGGYFGFIKKRIKTLYVPFIEYALPFVLFHNALFALGIDPNHLSSKEYVFQIIHTLLMTNGPSEVHLGAFWFLKVLFLAEIIYATIAYISHNQKVTNGICIIFGLIALIANKGIFPHVLQGNVIMPLRGLFYYTIAQVIFKDVRWKKIWYISIPIVLWWIVESFTAHYTEGNIQILSICSLNSIYQIVFTCGLFMILFLVSGYLKVSKASSWMKWMGRNTIPLYLLHQIMFAFISFIIMKLGYDMDGATIVKNRFINSIPWWAYGILVIPCCYLVRAIISRSFNTIKMITKL